MIAAEIYIAGEPDYKGRTYSAEELEHAVKEYNDGIANGYNLIMLQDNPMTPGDPITVNRIAGQAELYFQGGSVYAIAKILKTPLGRIAEQLYNAIGLNLVPELLDSKITLTFISTSFIKSPLYTLKEANIIVLDAGDILITQYESDK